MAPKARGRKRHDTKRRRCQPQLPQRVLALQQERPARPRPSVPRKAKALLLTPLISSLSALSSRSSVFPSRPSPPSASSAQYSGYMFKLRYAGPYTDPSPCTPDGTVLNAILAIGLPVSVCLCVYARVIPAIALLLLALPPHGHPQASPTMPQA